MPTPRIAYRTARRLVKNYRSEADLMRNHRKAMACRDCEDFLQLGIDSYRWVARLDEAVREAAYAGELRVEQKLSDALSALFESWLGPCEIAEKRIAKQLRDGFTPQNMDEFRTTCEQVRGIVEQRQWLKAAKSSRERQLGDEPW